ncbi:MAG TPA: hypothetical protein VFG69_02695 [Nannocystaceae bacterium]|nr:hypothetical protein [Nannocystaceae bacterium]
MRMAKWVGGLVGVAALVMGGCVAPEDEAELAAEEDEQQGDEDEARSGCVYLGGPPAVDDSASLVGSADLVASQGVSDGGCDLHTFNVEADPAGGDRAMLVQFDAYTQFEPPGEMSARVWRNSCTVAPCRWPSPTTVPLGVYGGGVNCNGHPCIHVPWHVYGEFEMGAGNDVHDLWAGMRVLDGDGEPIEVTITVTE